MEEKRSTLSDKDAELLQEVQLLREALRELVELVEDIDDTLFQHNYSIVGWHLNGEHEPIMNFVADFDVDILTKAKSLLKTEE